MLSRNFPSSCILRGKCSFRSRQEERHKDNVDLGDVSALSWEEQNKGGCFVSIQTKNLGLLSCTGWGRGTVWGCGGSWGPTIWGHWRHRSCLWGLQWDTISVPLLMFFCHVLLEVASNHIFSMAELFQFCTALSNEIIFLDVTAAMVRETELEGGLKSH